MNRRPRGRLALLTGLVLLLSVAPDPVLAARVSLPSGEAATAAADADAASKLRNDLAALVAGDAALDPRIANLVAGYRAGEVPFFAYLADNTAARRAALQDAGARVLRSYRSVPAVALAATPSNVLRVAAKPWVTWLAPIELVVALEEPVSQARATTEDIGAPPQWTAGVTGAGVRIAVLDTGVDPVHQDLDDLDFKQWSPLPGGTPKIVAARDFNGGSCAPVVADGHGHGTHVAGIATGTGEGNPLDGSDNGKYSGIAPGAELAAAKVITDAGTGLNSDLLTAMEWAAMPAGTGPLTCPSIGADIVNLSLGSEARPLRLNSDSDVDLVSLTLNRLAVQYGTLFVAAAGNSGPFIGSVLEAPGSAAQALSVGAAAKDWDVNHDDTLSGDTCAGWQHPQPQASDCSAGVGTQPPSVSSFSSRGPSGDVWLRPDLVAPGYNIVSTQSSTGVALAQNDLSRNTRADPLYATATGTSMAAPAAAGSAALVLDAYRQRYGGDPVGGSGLTGLPAPTYALLRAALMNSAGGDLYESRWILTTDNTTTFNCPDPDPVFGVCAIAEILADTAIGSLRLQDERNGAGDPYVGPLAEGAGKLHVARAVAALRDGLVVYSAASGSGAAAGTGHRDLQGSWQVGAVTASSAVTQRFVLRAAPGAGTQRATFSFEPGRPSDGSRAIPTSGAGAWTVTLPGQTNVGAGGSVVVTPRIAIPAATPAGTYTGILRVRTTAGQSIRIPVFASVALHDPNVAAGNAPGPQARITSGADVFAKDDTIWPSAAGTSPTGTNADWLVYPVELAAGLSQARFSVYDAAAGNETYDLYLYDRDLDLIASSHPFAAAGVTDVAANSSRAATPQSAPQVLSLGTPAAGRHYVVVSRARIGGSNPGDFGSFVLTLDEIRASSAPKATELAYEGDFIWTAGSPSRLAARLTDPSASGAPIAGRTVTFTVDGNVGLCGGGPCQAVTDYQGIAQITSSAITLPPGDHEVHARFAGDSFWLASAADAFVIVVVGGPPNSSGGEVTGCGWFVPNDAHGGSGGSHGSYGKHGSPKPRVYFAFEAESPGGPAPTGDFHWRDDVRGLRLQLIEYTLMLISGDQAELQGTARDASGATVSFVLTIADNGAGKGTDTIRLRVPDRGYDREGTLGGGDIRVT